MFDDADLLAQLTLNEPLARLEVSAGDALRIFSSTRKSQRSRWRGI